MPNIAMFQGSVPQINTVGSDAESVTSLLGGIEDNLPTLSIRGATFRLFFNGEETVIRGPDQMPAKMLDVVLLRASKNISRSFYADAYQEGKRQRPTCFSTDGIKPDDGSEMKQSQTCAMCPHMKFDQPTARGGRTKRCSDSRLIAISALGDLGNSAFGMPCTIRLSYRNMMALKEYAEFLRDELSITAYNHVVTRLSFDPSAAFPLLSFEPLRAVTQTEYDQYSKYYDPAQEGSVLEKVLRETPATAAAVAQQDVMQGPVGVATPAQAPAPAPVQTAPVQPAPAGPTTTVTETAVPWGTPQPAGQQVAPAVPQTPQQPAAPAFGVPQAATPEPAPAPPQPAPAQVAQASAPAEQPAKGEVIDQIEPGVPTVTTATDAVNEKLNAFLSGNA